MRNAHPARDLQACYSHNLSTFNKIRTIAPLCFPSLSVCFIQLIVEWRVITLKVIPHIRKEATECRCHHPGGRHLNISYQAVKRFHPPRPMIEIEERNQSFRDQTCPLILLQLRLWCKEVDNRMHLILRSTSPVGTRYD